MYTFKNYVLLGGIPKSCHHRTLGQGFSIIFDIIGVMTHTGLLKTTLSSQLETLEQHLADANRPAAGQPLDGNATLTAMNHLLASWTQNPNAALCFKIIKSINGGNHTNNNYIMFITL